MTEAAFFRHGDAPKTAYDVALALHHRCISMADENARLLKQRDALAAELEALKPKADAKPVNNPFARRHDGRAPDRRE